MKLLLATDGSPCSDAAVREVSSRPWPPGTSVTVLSVASLPFPTETGQTFDMSQVADELCPRIVETAARRIRDRAPGLRVEHRVANDLPKRAILSEADRDGADLILLGSHGYGPVRRMLMGSVSHAVAMYAPCSVEIVRERPAGRDAEGPMKILLATDGSPHSEAAVREVCERPWPPGSEIKVVTAIRTLDLADPYWTEALPQLLAEQQRADAPVLLEKAAGPIRQRHGDLIVVTETLGGPPQYAILDEAERWGADLILVGSHGYGAVGRVLLGSVSHAAALYAPCSVEIVRSRSPRVAE